MIPQSTFMVMARIDPRRLSELRALLASMNDAPGQVNANNALIPFAQFDMLHVARLVIIDDKTVDDVRVYGLTPPQYPLYLALLGDVDGDPNAFLEALARQAPAGLRAIWACCEDFPPGADLFAWMKQHSVGPAATYVNWVGRTVRRAREDAAVFDAIQRRLESDGTAICKLPARDVHAVLRQHMLDEQAAGRLALAREPPTPPAWRIRNALHLVGVPLLGLLASPVLIPVAVVGLLRLRALERSDPELCPRTDDGHAAELAQLEDHDVSNQFTAMGSLKPGAVRLWATKAVFFAIDYAARHVFRHGGLARVRTIHFARWVFLDGGKRAVFFSNYDGSLESYMDDFINKVGFGLNLAFNAAVGYPSTRWLFLDGSGDERKFKEYLRRHQLPTQVWYKALPGVTAVDLERNGRVRAGLESPTLSEQAAREWVALL